VPRQRLGRVWPWPAWPKVRRFRPARVPCGPGGIVGSRPARSGGCLIIEGRPGVWPAASGAGLAPAGVRLWHAGAATWKAAWPGPGPRPDPDVVLRQPWRARPIDAVWVGRGRIPPRPIGARLHHRPNIVRVHHYGGGAGHTVIGLLRPHGESPAPQPTTACGACLPGPFSALTGLRIHNVVPSQLAAACLRSAAPSFVNLPPPSVPSHPSRMNVQTLGSCPLATFLFSPDTRAAPRNCRRPRAVPHTAQRGPLLSSRSPGTPESPAGPRPPPVGSP